MFKHKFFLTNGEQITTYSPNDELPNYKYGDVAIISSKNGGVKYAIPVMNIAYIETEEVAVEDEYLCKLVDWLDSAVDNFLNELGKDGKDGKK